MSLKAGTPVVVTVRGKTHDAQITGKVDTAKGVFYETVDSKGFARKVRPAGVTVRTVDPMSALD